MHSRHSSQWKSRRKHSLALGPVRRAHPASGATWNVQVVRGKITSRCLWHACRALAIGIVLMLLGAGMATIGYYADELSIGREIRGNATVRVKNESRGFHLNNLSYAGPIVMGVGGFIVVAACVMTFEARDSAAKVVPARFKVSGGRNNFSKSRTNSSSSRRTARWEHQLGVFRTSPACEAPPAPPPPAREALTAALVHFSKALGTPTPLRSTTVAHQRRISRSGSVPNLSIAENRASTLSYTTGSPATRRCSSQHQQHHHHTYHPHHGQRNSSSRTNSISNRFAKYSNDSRLLHPGMLQLHRQALSVDETGPYYRVHCDSISGSKSSVAIEVHGGLVAKDRTKRSDIARRHILSRQKPVEKEEPHSPRTSYHSSRRRSSGASDVSTASKRLGGGRRASSVSRTASMDSRVGVHGGASMSAAEININNSNNNNNVASPERFYSSPRTSRHYMQAQQSTPSVEREFRSQLSVCSDPTNAVRQLSCQSSIEPCVPEESPEQEENEEAITNRSNNKTNKDNQSDTTTQKTKKSKPLATSTVPSNTNSKQTNMKTISRPETLKLQIDNNSSQSSPQHEKQQQQQQQQQQEQQTQQMHKYLYRSNSTRSFRKPKPKLKLSSELYEQIYFIGNNRTDDDNYNSIEVIDERRRKNFTRNANNETSINSNNSNNNNNNNNSKPSENCGGSNIDSNNVSHGGSQDQNATIESDGKRNNELDLNVVNCSSNELVNGVVRTETCGDSEQIQETMVLDSKNGAAASIEPVV